MTQISYFRAIKWQRLEVEFDAYIRPFLIRVNITPEMMEIAKKKAAELKTNLNSNIIGNLWKFSEDSFIVGILGELAVKKALEINNINFVYCDNIIKDEIKDETDFIINGEKVDIKTRKCNTVSYDYYCPVSVHQIDKVQDWYIFCSYNEKSQAVTILGKIRYKTFMKHSRKIYKDRYRGNFKATFETVKAVNITVLEPIFKNPKKKKIIEGSGWDREEYEILEY